MLKVTIGCQLSLMMLIEEYELNGISVKSANTDGVLTLYDKSLSSLKAEIAKKWSETTHLILENQFYESIYFQSVNDYIAKTTTGEIKRKGDFLIDLEFHKNKSHRIIPIALGEYFINGNKNIEEFVNNHSNLIDFCIRANVNRNFQLELHKKEEVEVYNKVLRYYISNEGGELLKIKRPECTTNAAPISQVNVGCLVTIVNNPKALGDPYHFSNINRKWYIDKIYEIIRQIELGRKVKTKKIVKEQLSLF